MSRKETIDSKELAAAHWEYVKEVLMTAGVTEKEYEVIGFHYRSAFIHGFKHGQEALDD